MPYHCQFTSCTVAMYKCAIQSRKLETPLSDNWDCLSTFIYYPDKIRYSSIITLITLLRKFSIDRPDRSLFNKLLYHDSKLSARKRYHVVYSSRHSNRNSGCLTSLPQGFPDSHFGSFYCKDPEWCIYNHFKINFIYAGLQPGVSIWGCFCKMCMHSENIGFLPVL